MDSVQQHLRTPSQPLGMGWQSQDWNRPGLHQKTSKGKDAPLTSPLAGDTQAKTEFATFEVGWEQISQSRTRLSCGWAGSGLAVFGCVQVQVRSGLGQGQGQAKVRLGLGQARFRAGQIRLGQVRFRVVWVQARFGLGQVRFGAGQVWGRLGLGQVQGRLGQIRLGKLRLIRLGLVRLSNLLK